MSFFETETGSIYFEIHGDEGAPPITLLHNFMSSGRTAWGSMLEALTPHYRVLLPDSPGHGRSHGYPSAFDHRLMARQLTDLMKQFGFENGHLAGVSSGGMIAQQMVHQQLVQPATLTLVSTTYSNNSTTTGVERAVKPENFKAGGRWLEATARLHDPHHYEGYFDEVILASFRALTAAQTIDLSLQDVAKWSMPVCLIQGEEDEFFAPQIVYDMADVLPEAEVHVVPRQPHALIFRRPWAVQEILLKFLQRHSLQTER